MGVVAVVEQLVMDQEFSLDDVGMRWELYCKAVVEVEAAVETGELEKLPSRLMQIFDKYATKDALGDEFSPLEEQSGDFTGTYDLEFVSEVLTEALPYIGAGSYSEAYNLNDDWVLKVNCRDRYWSPQDGAFGWLKTCTTHQSNPFLPKMKALEQKSHLFFAVVEKLSTGVGLDFENGSLGDLAYQSYDPEFDAIFYIADPMIQPSFRSFIARSPDQAVEAARIFENHRSDVRGNDDICDSGNIMHRNGWPVLNDPICDVQSAYLYLDVNDSFSWMCKN